MEQDYGRLPTAPGLRPCGAEPAAQSQAEPLVPSAGDDPIVGHKTMRDGSHVPLRRSEAEAIWAEIEAANARRIAEMPDERSAINKLFDAYQRLRELGWNDPIYAPKDGSPLDLIELGSTGIHRGHYDGKWPDGRWWIYDGDVWPSRPALARPASGIETEGQDRNGLGAEPESPTGKAGDAPPLAGKPS